MNILNKYWHLSAFLLLGPLCFGQYQFEVKNVSKSYDAVIHVENCYDDRCGGKGTVELFDHKNSKVQTFVSKDLVLYTEQGQKPIQGKLIPLLKDQRAVIIDDFNFDGTEDVAIRNGNMGNYSGASYDVYVFNKTRLGFVKSDELTELGSNGLDIFDIDAKRKRLISYGKSGCCDIFTSEYAVIPNKGLDKVFEKEEDMSIEGSVKVTTKEKLNNKWITKTKVYPSDQYNRNKK
ncbi:hypothetical protein ABE425_04325 [Chryseobacterium cucumeris]|uniref:XAC2610-related protein n=1 Tax=Chryseobacterium cucumeris TaxID=1813611 RepID=UPI0032099F98